MRRILLLVTAAAVMASMTAFGAAPAMAQSGGDLAEFVYDVTKNPQKEFKKIDKNIKRDVLPEYEKLVDDADKTGDEAVETYLDKFKRLVQEVQDGLINSNGGGGGDGDGDDGGGGGGGGVDCGPYGCGG